VQDAAGERGEYLWAEFAAGNRVQAAISGATVQRARRT